MKPDTVLSKRSFFHKTDWIAVILLLAVSLGLWGFAFFSSGAEQALIEITCDNVLVERIRLPAEDRLIHLPDRKMTLELKDNHIRVKETDCSDQTCMRTGFIERSGQTIICLPNRVVVRITGTGSDREQTDAIAG